MSAWNFIDLTGQKFGHLTVIARVENKQYNSGQQHTCWKCRCDCGKEIICPTINLRRKTNPTISCGCIKQSDNIPNKQKIPLFYDLTGEFGIGYTRKHEPFWFDLEDYDKIKNYCWSYNSNGYLCTCVKGKHISLHRLIMNVQDSKILVDHIIHDKKPNHQYDNRKQNLRLVSPQQNAMNSFCPKNNTSGYKGVYYDKKHQAWVAQITINRKTLHLGSFQLKDEAIQARQEAAKQYFKEYNYTQKQKEEKNELSTIL